MRVVLSWDDLSGVNRLMNVLSMLSGHQKHFALQRAVNHTGDKVRTQVVRTLSKQTGLPNRVIKKSVKVNRAWGASADAERFKEGQGSLSYVMTTRGNEISLAYFNARETRKGVTATPHGVRRLFPGAFMKGGRFPSRVEAHRIAPHVWQRDGSARLPIDKVMSGVTIPVEMLKGATLDAFMTTAQASLPDRVMHEINRLAPRVFD